MIEFQFKKHVKVVCTLEVGQRILIKDWGYKLDGEHIIEDFKFQPGCESSVLVKVSGYDSFIDSGWITLL